MPRGVPNSGPKAKTGTAKAKRRKRRKTGSGPRRARAVSASGSSYAVTAGDLGTIVGNAIKQVLSQE